MKARSAFLHQCLAIAGLLAVYESCQRPPENLLGEVIVLDARMGTIEHLRYIDGEVQLELLGSDAGDEIVWVRRTEGTRRTEQRGNPRSRQLLSRFAPLRSSRALGVLSGKKRAELGFGARKRQLEVETSTGSRQFELAQGENGACYLSDVATGVVYLMAGDLLAELEPSAQHLLERRLHAFNISGFDAITVALEGKTVDLVVSGNEERIVDGLRLPMRIAIAPAGEAPKDFTRTWHSKLWTVTPNEWLSRGEEPPTGAPRVRLRLDYVQRDEPRGFLEVAESPTSQLWARTELTTGWVQLPLQSHEVFGAAARIISRQ